MLIILIILLILILAYLNYNQENFVGMYNADGIFTANPVNMVSSACIDNTPAYVRFSQAGGIMDVSNHGPVDRKCKRILCPHFINGLITLRDDNYCYSC
jgi:hypothetical protein